MSKFENMNEQSKKSRFKRYGKGFFEHVPDKDWILTKVSHVNEAMIDLQAEVHDEQDNKECHFLRVLRIGPLVVDKESVVKGKLVIAHETSGKYLKHVSKKYGEEYYLIRENDILAFVDL